MRHLNYNHLQYFWVVAREGSIARAAEVLHLTPQTISGQLKLLEDSIGAALFQRAGRGLVLTESGLLVQQYAEEIFTLGGELSERLRSGGVEAPETLKVGIVDSIAKLIAYRVIQPALSLEDAPRIICEENDIEALLGELAVHRLDLVISDRPLPTGLNVRAYNHPLGQSSIAWFAGRGTRYARSQTLPELLRDAPMLLPMRGTPLRRSLDDYFDRLDITPKIIAEFDDSALLKAFGEGGVGIFPAPVAIAPQVERMYRVRQIGESEGVIEQYFAISPERKLKHPAVLSIIESARVALSMSTE